MGLLTSVVLFAALFSGSSALAQAVAAQTASIQDSESIEHPDEAICRVCAARSTHGEDPEAEEVTGVSLHDGKHYYFCTDDCKAEFDLSPDWWAPLELPFAVPALRARHSDGDVESLVLGEGKFTILDFWATWCQPCRKTMRQLQALFEEGQGDLRIVGISIDEGDKALKKVRKAIKSQKISYPIFLDDQASPAWTTLKVYAVPTIMLIDREGNVVWRFTGPDGDEHLQEELEKQRRRQ